MIYLEFRNVDDSGPLLSMVGSSLNGAATAQLGLLKNTGDENIQKVHLWMVNDLTKPLSCTASVAGSTVPDVQDAAAGVLPAEAVMLTPGAGLPAGGLPPGASLPLTITWSGPAGTTFDDLDTATLEWGAQ